MPASSVMIVVAIALFGLALGSFLNVCIFRIPRQESIITPRSHCPHCGKPVRWYDNVPAISFLVLGGRCRDCRARISRIYPLVETLTPGLLLAAFFEYGLTPEFIKYSVLTMLLLVLIFTDLNDRRIPHTLTLFGMAIGLILSFVVPVDNRPLEWGLRRMGVFVGGEFSSLLGSVTGALAGGGLFYVIGQAFFILGGREKEYLGFGDVMLMLMVGTFLGIPLTLLAVLLGSLLGTLVAVPLEFLSPRFRHYAWPYGSFLGAAAIYSCLGGKALLEGYARWAGWR